MTMLHFRQLGYSACGPFKKKKKFTKVDDSMPISKNRPEKFCYGKSQTNCLTFYIMNWESTVNTLYRVYLVFFLVVI